MITGVLAELAGQGRTVAVAESLTGGSLAAALVSVPGASAVFLGGVVAYATAAKAQVLGVDPDLLATWGAVDAAVALAMADRVAALFGADLGVATTGVAGPDPQEGKAPGLVFVAVVDSSRGVREVQQLDLRGDRNAIRSAAVMRAVRLLADVVAADVRAG